MKHISILVPEGDCSLTHIEATQQILNEVNVFLRGMDRSPLFTIQLVGLDNKQQIKKRHYSICPEKTIHEIEKTNLIIIPAIQGDLNKALDANKPFIPWLIKQ